MHRAGSSLGHGQQRVRAAGRAARRRSAGSRARHGRSELDARVCKRASPPSSVSRRARAVALLGAAAICAGLAASIVSGYAHDVRAQVGPLVPVRRRTNATYLAAGDSRPRTSASLPGRAPCARRGSCRHELAAARARDVVGLRARVHGSRQAAMSSAAQLADRPEHAARRRQDRRPATRGSSRWRSQARASLGDALRAGCARRRADHERPRAGRAAHLPRPPAHRARRLRVRVDAGDRRSETGRGRPWHLRVTLAAGGAAHRRARTSPARCGSSRAPPGDARRLAPAAVSAGDLRP